MQATTSKRINKKSTLFATILPTIMIENNMALRDPSYTPKRLPPPPPGDLEDTPQKTFYSHEDYQLTG